jgi:hypothetical protein
MRREREITIIHYQGTGNDNDFLQALGSMAPLSQMAMTFFPFSASLCPKSKKAVSTASRVFRRSSWNLLAGSKIKVNQVFSFKFHEEHTIPWFSVSSLKTTPPLRRTVAVSGT